MTVIFNKHEILLRYLHGAVCRLLKTGFFALLFTPVIGLAAVPDDFLLITGRYVGQAYNGANMDPVVTVLGFDSQGRFAGTYSVEDEDGIFEGRLSNLIQEGPRRFSLEWTDQHGEGFVYLDFSSDYSSFDGFWTNTDGQSQLPWNGRRQ